MAADWNAGLAFEFHRNPISPSRSYFPLRLRGPKSTRTLFTYEHVPKTPPDLSGTCANPDSDPISTSHPAYNTTPVLETTTPAIPILPAASITPLRSASAQFFRPPPRLVSPCSHQTMRCSSESIPASHMIASFRLHDHRATIDAPLPALLSR